jgi:transcriptional regulator with XRE-family HTH domain
MNSEFGQFFRASRKGTGLKLREFCRRNGLDPALVSRLESGKLAPKNDRSTLLAYAKALKLDEQGTATLFKLAAQSITKDLRISGGTPLWTRAVHLENWAESLDARSTLPQLVRRLVHATCPEVLRIAFPAGEGVGRRSWDGIVETAVGNAFVPAGTSAWEGSAQKDSRKKATDAFETRLKDPDGVAMEGSTFVFVTPRKWEKKEEWRREALEKSTWKDVRVYDSADLEEWLEMAPGVDNWLAAELGLKPPGAYDAGRHWTNLAALHEPRLTPAVFLVSRKPQTEDLEKWLLRAPGPLRIETSSSPEAIDFFSAWLASLDVEKRDAIAAKALIVEDRNAWGSLTSSKYPLILIPSFPIEPELIVEATRLGHFSFVPIKPNEGAFDCRLRRVSRFDLEQALVAAWIRDGEDFDDEKRAELRSKARRLAQQSGGSLTILKRMLSGLSRSASPAWADGDTMKRLSLLGAWDDRMKADREIIEKLCGVPYPEIAEEINRWLVKEEPPLVRAVNEWEFVSREDAWAVVAPTLSAGTLERFQNIAVEVLAQDDPQYDKPASERWAFIDADGKRASSRMRKGIATTLALIGADSETPLLPTSIVGKDIADSILDSVLPKGAPGIRWTSLSSVLDLLAESAPDAFLSALEDALSDVALDRLFESGGNGIFGSHPHVGLCWALETLAWAPKHLSEAAQRLARLAEIDLKGGDSRSNVSPRPDSSLVDIFLPWYPHTSADWASRSKVLDILLRKSPVVGWNLLFDLISTDGTSGTSLPSFRDWARQIGPILDRRSIMVQIDFFAERLLKTAGRDPSRWIKLIDRLEFFPKQEQLLEQLSQLAEHPLESEVKTEIADHLRQVVGQGRRHDLISEDMASRIESVQRRFEPSDLKAKHAWLFTDWPDLPNLPADISYDEEEDAIKQARQKAIEDIYKIGGLAEVKQLAEIVASSWHAGYTAIALGDHEHEILGWLTSESEAVAKFAAGYCRRRFRDGGWSWIRSLPLDQWESNLVAYILLAGPFQLERTTWEMAAKHGSSTEEIFWKKTLASFPPSPAADPVEVEYALTKMKEGGRPMYGVCVAEDAIRSGSDIPPGLVIDLLEQYQELEADKREGEITDHVRWIVQKVFSWLQNNPRTDIGRLEFLEWKYVWIFDLIEGGSKPVSLYKAFRDHPSLFVQLMNLVYGTKESAGERGRDFDRIAYFVLKGWIKQSSLKHSFPGAAEDGSIDEGALIKWANAFREQVKSVNLVAVGDATLGELLANSPELPQGQWPQVAVCDLIEELANSDVERGFYIAIFNKRGPHFRSVDEGGLPERELVAKFDNYAKDCEIEWPRVAAILRDVAHSYRADARREDERALNRI